MLKLYPSAIDFSLNGLNLAEYESGCWRWILYTQGVRNQIDPAYQSVGAHHEDWYASTIAEPFEREVPFKLELGEATLSGRCDFKLGDRIDETKSTFDAKKLMTAPQRAHMAQLVIYLSHFEKEHGRLIYGHYQQAAPSLTNPIAEPPWELVSTRTVDIRLDSGGRVYADGIRTEWSVDDVVNTISTLERHYREDTVPERPPVFGYKSACKYCPAAMTCARYDAKEVDKEGLKAGIKVAAQNKPMHVAKYKKVKPAKAPKITRTKK